jgi:hypothetical protein
MNVSVYPKVFKEFKYLIHTRNDTIVKCFLLAAKIRDPMQTFIFNLAATGN